jgi:hypothetical protein
VREFDLVDHSPAHDAAGEKIDPDALSNLRKGMKMISPNLEAQVLPPSASRSDLEPTVLPAPLPEPGTLLIFSVMLGAAGLCHRFKMSRSSRKFGSHAIKLMQLTANFRL